VENGSKIIGIYGGGFKPPTKGHFEVAQQALKQFPEMDELIIYVGSGERDKVDQAESVLVWNIYKKHLPSKVSVESVKAPIGDIFKYAKDHPEEKIYFILGAREGSEGDVADNAARTKSVTEKYPNIEVKIITTPDSGISGTNARKALIANKEAFFKYLPSVLSPVEKERIYSTLSPELVSENTTYPNIDYKKEIKELTKYMIKKGENILPLPKVIFKKDVKNAKSFFGKTGYYDPESKTIVLYVEGRHPKDIVRSFAHEMIHHIQNLEGRLGGISTTNTNEDQHLKDIEEEAYLKGNILFRNWTDSIVGNRVHETKIKDPFGITAYALELARGLEEQENPKYKIYVDMDGVLADFDKGYEDLTGITTKEADKKGPESFWEPISKAGAKFWITLKWMPDGKQLWDYVKKYNPELLSAPSREESSRMGKRVWVKRELPGTKLILKSADRKQELASPNSILIDDREKNIEQWRKAGGIGILHTDTASTIKKLKELGI